ncbi:MAG: ATP-binding protein [Elusimicrobiota bacterium]|nr:ATP-binding protein [Elusimicrobiota bacterium]
MKINYRLHLLTFAASLLPLLVFAVCASGVGLQYQRALLIAAVSVPAASVFAAMLVLAGLARPLDKVTASVKQFVAADYRLEEVLPKEGWPEAGSLISALNRLMLELSAYRAFHLNQVVEERGKAQALVETITDGVLLADDRGRLIYSNQTALKLLGIPRHSLDVVLPDSVKTEAFSPALREIMASAEKYMKVEVEVPVQDEDSSIVKKFRIIANQFSLATLSRPGRVLVIRDVTVEKELAEAKETFFHMITHDMRSPLSSIQGYTELLLKKAAELPDITKNLLIVQRSARRLNGMIDDILNTIKLERGTMELKLENIDAGALAGRISEVHAPLTARKGIKFSVLMPPEKLEFPGDAVLLERVITNLLGNSIKFTPEGGSITLSCRESGGEMLFAVEDTGPGIPEGKRKEVFEKHFQLEEHKFMGFGLGLAMCKMAVEIHKGRIWVESEVGKGSKFIFTIPKTALPAAGAAAQQEQPG